MLKHGYFTAVFVKSKRFREQSATKYRFFASAAKKKRKKCRSAVATARGW